MEQSKTGRFGPAARRDLYSGGLLIVIGIGALLQALTYDLGNLVHVGPGFFPMILGLLLAAIGVFLAINALLAAPRAEAEPRESSRGLDVRGFVAIVCGVAAFIVLAHYFGMAPAAFFCVFIAALGDRKSTVAKSAILALVMATFAVVLFSFLLHLPLPFIRMPTFG